MDADWMDLLDEKNKEIERLQKQIRYQEHRDGRVGTHDPICYGYGPSHYECALRKIDMLRELLNADNQTLRLHLGELTLKEMRIIKSAFQWVLIRAELQEKEMWDANAEHRRAQDKARAALKGSE
jgi:hypothetical protein